MTGTVTGTSGNDGWRLVSYYVGALDGLAGTDSLSIGTLSRSGFTLAQNTDGSIQLDTIAGASGALASHIILENMETLIYESGASQIDLTNYLGIRLNLMLTVCFVVLGIWQAALFFGLCGLAFLISWISRKQ